MRTLPLLLLGGCFLLSAEDVRRHDAELADPADTDTDTDTDTDSDTDTDTAPTGDTALPDTFTVRATGEAFVDFEGYDVVAVAIDAGGVQISAGSSTVAAGVFEITFPYAFVVGETYSVDVLVEPDGNASCATYGTYVTEATYRVVDITSDGPDRRARIDANTSFDGDACASFP